MTTSAERLINQLSTSKHLTVPGDTLRVAEKVETLDTIDPSFSSNAVQMLLTGDLMVEKMLVSWLDSNHRLDTALWGATEIQNSSGLNYTAANHVIYDVLLNSSLERLDISHHSLWNNGAGIRQSRSGHRLLLSSGELSLPDASAHTLEDFDSYFHPMAVATKILRPEGEPDKQHVISKMITFVSWASSHPNMREALSAAYLIGSTVPATVTSYLKLKAATTVPLRSGIL